MSRLERALGIIALLLFIGIFGLLLNLYRQQPETVKYTEPTVGFMLHGGREDAGWNRQLYLGVNKAARTVGVSLDATDKVTLAASKILPAMRWQSLQGNDFVIVSSADFSEPAHMLREEGFRTVYALPKLEERGENCVPYFLRLYQGEYLAGMLAGMHSASGKLGYVVSAPCPEICRCVNAFALGAREANAEAEVLVYWVGSWDAPEREQVAAEKLDKAGADVLNSHQDGMTVQAYAEKHGLEYVSYLEPYAPDGMEPEDCAYGLATIFCHWDAVYEALLRDYLRGRFQKSYWLGMESDAVELGDFSGRVSEQERAHLQRVTEMMKKGYTIFSGELRDNKGLPRCQEGDSLSDAALIEMDWFVEGVRFL